nr:uncharacterized protein LOC109163942 isoform X1 [Ipomoea trifida]
MPAPPPATASSSSPALDSHHDLLKLVRSHEVALAELNTIPASGVCNFFCSFILTFCLSLVMETSMVFDEFFEHFGVNPDCKFIIALTEGLSMTVFQRNGNLFFRTTAQKATSYEQKQLEMAKAKLQKLTS